MQRLSILILLLSLPCAVVRAEGLEVEPDESAKPAPLPEGARFQTGPDKNLQRLAISPDGKTIATASEAGAVVFWDAATGKSISTIAAAHDKCYCVDFTLDGKSVISCGADKLLKQWDIASGKMIKQFAGHTEEVKFVACSPDGKRVASCEGTTGTPTIRVWDIESGHELKSMTGHGDNLEGDEKKCGIDILAWSPDGRKLVSEASDVTARLWDAIAGRQIRILPQHDNSVAAVAISPDNSLGASTRHPDFGRDMYADPNDLPAPRPSELRIWKMSGAELKYELAPPNNVPKGIAVQRVIMGFEGDVSCVAFAPDNRTIVAGCTDETVRQWDLETGVEIRRFKLSSTPVHVAIFPDSSAAGVVSPREGLTILKLNDLLPGWNDPAGGPPCSGIDDAWTKLDAPTYGIRARAFEYFLKNVAPEQLAAEILRRDDAVVDDAEQKKKAEEAVAGLDSDNYSVRLNSMETLHDLAGAARAAVIDALKSPSNEVRVRAAEVLHDIGGGSPRRVLLIEMLKTVDRPEAKAATQTLLSKKDKK